MQESAYRDGWERTRAVMLSILSPFSKKPLKATDVAKFPWDEKRHEVPRGTSSRERMEKIAERVGIKA